MNEATLTALKESIKKWEQRAAGDHQLHIGASDCPLCVLFHSNNASISESRCCLGCPVYEKTQQKYCLDTPYHAYRVERTDNNAQKEVDFLKSLLPEEAGDDKKQDFKWANLDYLG